MILAAMPEAQVDGKAGRRTSFEVTINKVVVFSKLNRGAFPQFDKVVEEVQKASKGMAPEEVVDVQKSMCVIQ